MEIKKADSKGRVSGFTPGMYYDVERTRGSYTLSALGNDELLIVLLGDTAIPQAAQDYMESFGINPHHVPRDSATAEGYGAYIYDRDGKPIYKYGQRVIDPRPWPEGFSWEEFGRLILGG